MNFLQAMIQVTIVQHHRHKQGHKVIVKKGTEMTTSNPTINQPTGGKSGETSKYKVIIGDLDIPVRSGFSMDAKIPLKTKSYQITY